jgi:hypothetical protein
MSIILWRRSMGRFLCGALASAAILLGPQVALTSAAFQAAPSSTAVESASGYSIAEDASPEPPSTDEAPGAEDESFAERAADPPPVPPSDAEGGGEKPAEAGVPRLLKDWLRELLELLRPQRSSAEPDRESDEPAVADALRDSAVHEVTPRPTPTPMRTLGCRRISPGFSLCGTASTKNGRIAEARFHFRRLDSKGRSTRASEIYTVDQARRCAGLLELRGVPDQAKRQAIPVCRNMLGRARSGRAAR